MIVSVNLCRLMTETSFFINKRDDETTHYLKPPQAYITANCICGNYQEKGTTTTDTNSRQSDHVCRGT